MLLFFGGVGGTEGDVLRSSGPLRSARPGGSCRVRPTRAPMRATSYVQVDETPTQLNLTVCSWSGVPRIRAPGGSRADETNPLFTNSPPP